MYSVTFNSVTIKKMKNCVALPNLKKDWTNQQTYLALVDFYSRNTKKSNKAIHSYQGATRSYLPTL